MNKKKRQCHLHTEDEQNSAEDGAAAYATPVDNEDIIIFLVEFGFHFEQFIGFE